MFTGTVIRTKNPVNCYEFHQFQSLSTYPLVAIKGNGRLFWLVLKREHSFVYSIYVNNKTKYLHSLDNTRYFSPCSSASILIKTFILHLSDDQHLYKYITFIWSLLQTSCFIFVPFSHKNKGSSPWRGSVLDVWAHRVLVQCCNYCYQCNHCNL